MRLRASRFPAPDLYTLTRALAAFQRSLISVNSPYDRFKYWGEAGAADIIAFLESLTDEGFLANPAYADPWPADHPAVANRVLP